VPVIIEPEPQAAPIVFVPESVYAATERRLASQRAHEEVVYWAGVETDRVWVVLTCVSPEAATTAGSFATTAHANAEVIGWTAARGLSILGQLHCHPGLLVGHSRGDDKGALTAYRHALSIVVPNYGVDGLENFRRCGVHRFDGGGFRRLDQAEVQSVLRIIPTTFDDGDRHAAVP
jgi:hypothetical protein